MQIELVCAKVCNNCPPSQHSLALILFTSIFGVLFKAWKGLEDFHAAIPSIEADTAIINNTPERQQWEWHQKFYLRRWCAEAKAQRRPVETLQQNPGAGMPVPSGSVAEEMSRAEATKTKRMVDAQNSAADTMAAAQRDGSVAIGGAIEAGAASQSHALKRLADAHKEGTEIQAKAILFKTLVEQGKSLEDMQLYMAMLI